ncbi:UDP-glucose dehydrogenase family protein [Thermicanus aegyptius]|uniref:UDP-glucose dehydrogenase family protein n=1 Tax=Thermicanus aegyptius TaxID=94009 RepID=UPI0003F7686C|nr:UDP-glucose/GDP-mannose dehydrogenase family protein [Thermicanus aegyptius]
MKIAVIGAGYVGLVQAAGLAQLGHEVIAYDIHQRRIATLKKGLSPIYEPGLEECIKRGIEGKRLFFTDRLEEAVFFAPVLFLTVGTPAKSTGEADLSAVFAVAHQIALLAEEEKMLIIKSTVPVGTGDKVEKMMREISPSFPFHVVSNPEFLRQGSALHDFLLPDRIVIGLDDGGLAPLLQEIYKGIPAPILWMDRRSAEMVKYAANVFLATKISFINMMAELCESLSADVEMVSLGMGSDRRIGPHFLKAGIGFGGSCFPKDAFALMHMAREAGVPVPMVEAMMETNDRIPDRIVHRLLSLLPIKARRITLLGLTFKPGTDDLRDSPSLKVISHLAKYPYTLRAYDPLVKEGTPHPALHSVALTSTIQEAIEGTEAILLLTEWPEFKEADWIRLRRLVSHPLFIDGRNCLDEEKMKKAGFQYIRIGKKPTLFLKTEGDPRESTDGKRGVPASRK